ncbi:hypothetical protein BU17DRAFT_69908 [Hysterangium stoloniferum]|nr:hypothetical protein BU17DRAFT_69908 [Hysterangium stoloniferum]
MLGNFCIAFFLWKMSLLHLVRQCWNSWFYRTPQAFPTYLAYHSKSIKDIHWALLSALIVEAETDSINKAELKAGIATRMAAFNKGLYVHERDMFLWLSLVHYLALYIQCESPTGDTLLLGTATSAPKTLRVPGCLLWLQYDMIPLQITLNSQVKAQRAIDGSFWSGFGSLEGTSATDTEKMEVEV